jgi:dTDP-L-rhamnose 4-epimerase
MGKRYLVVGGAGFIGSHLADELLHDGHEVRIYDSLVPQVHGRTEVWPSYLHAAVELRQGDVRNAEGLARALAGVDGVFHLAARVGVGQSMYEIEDYVAANELGTATLLQLLSQRPVERLVAASSMSIYGEGLYRDAEGRTVQTGLRSAAQLRAQRWEPQDRARRSLEPIATPEDKTPDLASVYALSKYAQERMCLIVGEAYGIETVALRLFNVFGSRQALSNPYTGVLAIFAARLLNGRRPAVFEDGLQRRDFVHVKDVARAFHLAMTSPAARGQAINVGSGRAYTVVEVAHLLAGALGRPELTPEITGKARAGDIRHCFADISRAGLLLGFRPAHRLETDLDELVGWLDGQGAEDRIGQATAELERRGLVA